MSMLIGIKRFHGLISVITVFSNDINAIRKRWKNEEGWQAEHVVINR